MSKLDDQGLSNSVTLRPVPLTQENYAPYGVVLGPPATAATAGGQFTASWWRVFNLDVEGTPEIVFAHMESRPIEIKRFERHLLVTQAFAPLNGSRFLQVVAPPSAGPVPDLSALRTFVLDGSVGVALHKGTWHVEFFPLRSSGDFLVITRAETSAALQTRDPRNLVGDTDHWTVPQEIEFHVSLDET